MIIGISGYIGSGKDTVGKIIQYLDCKSRFTLEYPFVEFIAFGESDWKIKKFAGKLKQIASLLTGIPIEKFEDQEFKKTIMSSEWDIDFAPIQVREFLQKLGTEVMRDKLHTNVWVNALFADYYYPSLDWYHTALEGGYTNDTQNSKGKMMEPNWIITDVRFPNEAEAIKDKGGFIIRVNRYQKNHKSAGLHPSEISLDSWKFDEIVENNGTIEELTEKVKEVLKKRKIL